MKASPCLNCQNRRVPAGDYHGCHTDCQEYIGYDLERKEYRKHLQQLGESRGYTKDAIERINNQKHKNNGHYHYGCGGGKRK